MPQDGVGCKECKRVKEHLASLLPFRVIESSADRPLCIDGIVMAAGMSRNFNIYTQEELSVFAEKLVNSPVYMEAGPVGFEPTISGSEGRHLNPC